jgi:hypothetical protein
MPSNTPSTMHTIEIEHISELDYVKIYINTDLVAENINCKKILIAITDTLPVQVAIDFFPFKIKPIVRVDNFLLDYWLADIKLWDHRLEFNITETFYEDYKNKNIAGRIASLTKEQQNIEHFWDKYIGINNLHSDLVDKIKNLINK